MESSNQTVFRIQKNIVENSIFSVLLLVSFTVHLLYHGDVNKKSKPLFFWQKRYPTKDFHHHLHICCSFPAARISWRMLRSRCQRCTLHRQGRQEVRVERCRPGRSHGGSNDVDQATEEGGTVARYLRFVRPYGKKYLGKEGSFPWKSGDFLRVTNSKEGKQEEPWKMSDKFF